MSAEFSLQGGHWAHDSTWRNRQKSRATSTMHVVSSYTAAKLRGMLLGAVEEGTEALLIVKTTRAAEPALVELVIEQEANVFPMIVPGGSLSEPLEAAPGHPVRGAVAAQAGGDASRTAGAGAPHFVLKIGNRRSHDGGERVLVEDPLDALRAGLVRCAPDRDAAPADHAHQLAAAAGVFPAVHADRGGLCGLRDVHDNRARETGVREGLFEKISL